MREIVVPPEKRVLERRGGAVAAEVQAGPEGDGQGQADRPGRQAVRRLDGADGLRQGRRVHLRRLERAGDQGVLLEVAAAPLPADRIEPRSLVRQPGQAERDRHAAPGHLRRSRSEDSDGRRRIRSSWRARWRHGAAWAAWAARLAKRRHVRRADGSRRGGGRAWRWRRRRCPRIRRSSSARNEQGRSPPTRSTDRTDQRLRSSPSSARTSPTPPSGSPR